MAAGIGVPHPVMGEIGRYNVVPQQIVLREELPLTPAGKIQKALLRAEGPQP